MSEDRPSLSIVIPWCNRPEIGSTLRSNAPHFIAAGAEVVIVNCGGDPDRLTGALAGELSSELHRIDLPAADFNKGLALNLGVAVARSERLFFLDADIVLQEGVLPQGLALLAGHCFVTIDRVVESVPTPTFERPGLREVRHIVELVGPRNRKVRLETNRTRFHDNSRSGPGLLLLRREHFLAVDGMNSDLQGWGWEDLDLLARLQFLLRLPRRPVGAVVHLSHGDEVRSFDGPTPSANEQRNYAMCLANYGFGHYRGTYEDDVETWAGRIAIPERDQPA